MDTRRVVGGAAVLVAAVVVIALVVGGAGRYESVEPGDETFDPTDIGETPLVVARHETGGFELFGIRITAPDRWLGVGIAPLEECIGSDDRGIEILRGDAPCGEYAPLAGPVLGGGRTAQGVRWVEVRVDVDRACLDASVVGDPWPSPRAACN